MCFWLCAVIAAYASEAPTHRGQEAHTGAQPAFSNINQTRRCLRTYQAYMLDSDYVKQHKVITANGTSRHMDIITANITSLHDDAPSWLAEPSADSILVQEHRLTSLKSFGKNPGYDVIFSPARRTICSDRGWETSGGVVILYRTQQFHRFKDKGIRTKGHNWATLRIKLEKQQELIIVNMYTKHGWDIETQVTLEQAQQYISTYALP